MLRCAGKKLHGIFSSFASLSEKEGMRKRFLEECLQLSSLRHPNIVQLMGLHTCPGDTVPMMVMECMHATLRSCLEKNPNVPVSFKRRILHDVSLGLRFLHERSTPIIHRDLTANNIMLTEDLRAKITDLGVARMLTKDMRRKLTEAPGNSDYMPPEALVGEPSYDTSLDMFSFGILIVHTVTGDWPSAHLSSTVTDSQGRLVARSEVQRRASHFSKMEDSDTLKYLAETCLRNDPTARPTAKDISEELRSLLDVPSSPSSFPLLETLVEKEGAERRRDELQERSKEVESQLHKIVQDLHEKPTLNEPELDKVIKQLHIVLHSTSLALYCPDDMRFYDPSVRRFIVAYKPPPAMEASAGRILHVSSPPTCPNPLSLVVCAPVNLTFSGMFVKTVVSGLGKSLHMAISGDQLFVVDNRGWMGVYICSISGEFENRSIIESSSKMEFTGMTLEKCWQPRGVAIDAEHNVILADTGSERVTKFSPDGSFLATSGKLLESGAELGEFDSPFSVTLARDGDLYVCDRSNHRVQILDSNLVSRRAFGTFGKGNCEFRHPLDLAFDSRGNVYVVDCSNFCIKVFTPGFGKFIRRIGKEGIEVGDFQAPSSICIDSSDNVYVTDYKFCCVKVFDSTGRFVMQFGSYKDPRSEFCFLKPRGIAVDSIGRVFVSDSDNGRVLMYQ